MSSLSLVQASSLLLGQFLSCDGSDLPCACPESRGRYEDHNTAVVTNSSEEAMEAARMGRGHCRDMGRGEASKGFYGQQEASVKQKPA